MGCTQSTLTRSTKSPLASERLDGDKGESGTGSAETSERGSR